MSSISEKSEPYAPLVESPQKVMYAFPPQPQAMYFVPINSTPVQMMVVTPQPQVAIQVAPVPVVTPNTHLILTTVLFTILTIFAPETLFIMIPALVLSAMSHHANNSGNYMRAKRLGTAALVLNFVGILVAFVVAMAVVILTLSLYPWPRVYDYYYGGCYSYYDYSNGEGSGVYLTVCA